MRTPRKSDKTGEKNKSKLHAPPSEEKKATTKLDDGKVDGAPAQLALAALSLGMPGLTPAGGQILAEAAAVCLESHKHQSPVLLPCYGLMRNDVHLAWQPIDEQQRRAYADIQEATEWGACGVAILVVKEAIGKVVVERSRKGTGCDYWLGEEADDDDDNLLFTGGARLEFSGI